MSTPSTKLTSDIAESATATKLLKLGLRVLRPIGDRLPYDLAIDNDSNLIRIQVKSAWQSGRGFYTVDNRRTRTNRKFMKRCLYSCDDFDFAIIYINDVEIFYIMPVQIFLSYKSGIAFVESPTRQRLPKSHNFREAWHLLMQSQ